MQIQFENDGQFEVDPAGSIATATLLELALDQGIAHIHACGGNARCSTCRVMVLEHPEHLSAPTDAERALAARKGLEPNIRLACQARPTGDVRVRRLVIDSEDADIAIAQNTTTSAGREQSVAILFSDIRGFTTFSENMLPYDVIHVLNRYFRKMGEAIHANGGQIDKYMGDGIMAIFGLDAEVPRPDATVRAAIQAGLDMFHGLSEFNVYLRDHFQNEFQMGIGIHYGEVIIGQVGHPRSMQFSALGDAVNMASRIEGACKRASAHFLISEAAYHYARDLFRFGRRFRMELRGKTGRHRLVEVLGEVAEQNGDALSAAPADLAPLIRGHLRPLIGRDQAPRYLRLVFHDAASFDALSGSGGCDGSVRFECDRPENESLRPCAEQLAAVQQDLAERGLLISFADLLVFAGALAVEICGGPAIALRPGRQDAPGPAPAGFIPGEHENYAELMRRFAAMGLDVQDLVALSGAHTLGGAHGKPFTEDLFHFSNSYFQRLALEHTPPGNLHLLPSDRALLQSEEARALVMLYARDEQRFFRDFAQAYRKMVGEPRVARPG